VTDPGRELAARTPLDSATPREPDKSERGPAGNGAAVPLVADTDHFRTSGESLVLYLTGDHIPAHHAGLPTEPAVMVDGVYVPAPRPKGRGRR